MEKKVYDLKINENLEHAMPALRDLELEMLTNSLLAEGCRDPLVTWNGFIVDGHNRYRICLEHHIPFSYVSMDFESEKSAKTWIIRNQLARRNVPDFVRCEMVLPLEEELRKEAKERQGWRKKETILPQNSAKRGKETREELAEMAGVSRDTIMKVKKLVSAADDETIKKLRDGEISIHKAYIQATQGDGEEHARENENPKALNQFDKKAESLSEKVPEETAKGGDKSGELFLGFDTEQILGPLAKDKYVRPPESVYDIPPIKVYGNMPADDMKLRGNAEFVHARSELQTSTEYYVRRAGEILRGMSVASVNDENMTALLTIVTDGLEQIKEMMETKKREEK